MIINMDDKYYKYFLKKLIRVDLKVLHLAQKTKKPMFLKPKKNKDNYLLKIRIKSITKTFKISKELLNYKENILASLSIICNYFDAKNWKKTFFKVSVF